MSRYEELIAELALILIEGAKEHVGDLGPDDDEFECARELAIDATRSASSVRDDLMEAMKNATKPVPLEESYTVEVVFDDHDSFYKITKANLAKVLAEPDLHKRDGLFIDLATGTMVGGDADTDLVLVLDTQQAEERWGDFEDLLAELEGE